MAGDYVIWLRPLGRVRKDEWRLLLHLALVHGALGAFLRLRSLVGELALPEQDALWEWSEPAHTGLLVTLGLALPLLLIFAFGLVFDRAGARTATIASTVLIVMDVLCEVLGVGQSGPWQGLWEHLASGVELGWFVLVEGLILVRLTREVGIRLLPLLAVVFYLSYYLVDLASDPLYSVGPAGLALAAIAAALMLGATVALALWRLPMAKGPARESDERGTLLLVARHRYLIGLVFAVAAVNLLADIPEDLASVAARIGNARADRFFRLAQLIEVGALLWLWPPAVRRFGGAPVACALVFVSLAALTTIVVSTSVVAPAVILATAAQRVAAWAVLAAWLVTPPTHKLKGRVAAALAASYLVTFGSFGASFVDAGVEQSMVWLLAALGLATAAYALIAAVTVRGREPEPVSLEDVFS